MQDARGRWYVQFQLEVNTYKLPGVEELGIDLGLGNLVTCSDGTKLSRENLTKTYEDKLAKAQRAHKTKQVRNIHAKIANKRKDWNHKTSTTLVKRSHCVAIGALNAKGLMKTKMAKSVADASWGGFRQMLVNKANAHRVESRQVPEAYTTQTCHVCNERTGPKGLEGLGVREWKCPVCGTQHDRDVNAAINIFVKGFGRPPNKKRELRIQ